MVNYLWPSFTMLSAIAFNKQKSNLLIVPGFGVAIVGICWVLGADQGLDIAGMAENIKTNPLSYGLAFSGALIWAAYCTVTSRMAGGKNGITLFFMLTALALWAKYLTTHGETMEMSYQGLIYLAMAASAMGFGYAAWNVGILHGNVTILAGASYFIPVLSAALAAMLLRAPLSPGFGKARRWCARARSCAGSRQGVKVRNRQHRRRRLRPTKASRASNGTTRAAAGSALPAGFTPRLTRARLSTRRETIMIPERDKKLRSSLIFALWAVSATRARQMSQPIEVSCYCGQPFVTSSDMACVVICGSKHSRRDEMASTLALPRCRRADGMFAPPGQG
jgi:hypothetical protein